MKKYIINILLIVIWMFVIFSFSNQNGETSKGASDTIIIKVAEVITKEKLTEEKEEKLTTKYKFIVRKTAHVTEYFILGILVFFLFNKMYGIGPKTFIYTIIFCFIYASTDEIHQYFISDRSARFTDVLIDTFGGFLATSILTWYYWLKNKKLMKENN